MGHGIVPVYASVTAKDSRDFETPANYAGE